MKITLEQFVNTTNCSMAMFDIDLNYLAISDNFTDDLNQYPTIGSNFKDNLLNSTENFKSIHESLLSGKVYVDEKNLFLFKNKSADHLYWTTITLKENNKSIGGFIFVLKNKIFNTKDDSELFRAKIIAKRRLDELENIYLNAPVGLCFIDNNLNFIRVNKQFADIFNSLIDDMIGRNIIDTLPTLSLIFEEICNKIKTSNTSIIRKDISYDDSEYTPKRFFNEIWYPTSDINGKLSGIGIVIQEITNLKHIDALLKADDHKNTFLATLSHELRNPLSAIRNALYLLENYNISDENIIKQNKLAINIASERADHMIQLINGLIDLTRINQGKIELNITYFSLVAVLQKIILEVKITFKEKEQTLEIRTPKEPLVIHADYLRIYQIFSNVLDNACKYTQPGGTITLDAFIKDSQAVVIITDNGIGIESDHLESIFDIFSQVTINNQPSLSGIGIGLSLCKKLIYLHKGKIQALSKGLGQGSQFIITLPLESTHQSSSIK